MKTQMQKTHSAFLLTHLLILQMRLYTKEISLSFVIIILAFPCIWKTDYHTFRPGVICHAHIKMKNNITFLLSKNKQTTNNKKWRSYIYLLWLVMDAAVTSALCCISQSFAWFPMVTRQAERMTGSLVKISPPLSIAYLPPLHWTVVHICCRENRPHLCKWGGHVLRHTLLQQFAPSRTHECPRVRLIWLCIYRMCLCFTGHWVIQMQSWNRESWDGVSALLMLLCWTSCEFWLQPDLCAFKKGFCEPCDIC